MKTRGATIAFGLEVFAALFVAGGGGCTDSADVSPVPEDAAAAADPDTDGDGLTDHDEETLYGTSPIMPDTDGDGFSDGVEILQQRYDPDYPYRFNPRVADVPDLGVQLASPPEVVIVFTDARGVARTFTTTTTDQQSSSETDTAAETVTRTDSINTPVAETQSTVLTGPFSVDAGRDAGFVTAPTPTTRADTASVTTTFNPTTTFSTAYAFTRADTLALTKTFAAADAYSESQTTTDVSGVLKVTVVLQNHGHLGFSIPNMLLGATVTKTTSRVAPVGNLVPDTPYLVSEPVALAPAQDTGPVVFIRSALSLSQARSLLQDASTLVVQLSALQLDDADGKPFAARFTEVAARDALVMIDYGKKRASERHLVATAGHQPPATVVPGEGATITAGEVFNDILRIPIAADATSGLTAVRGVGETTSDGEHWTAQRTRGEPPAAVTTTTYDAQVAPYDFTAIELRAGDVLALKLGGHE